MATFPRGICRQDRVLVSKLLRAARCEVVPEMPVFASKLPGDTEALRGIPAIGRGVAGVIPGTAPGSVRSSGVSSAAEPAALERQ